MSKISRTPEKILVAGMTVYLRCGVKEVAVMVTGKNGGSVRDGIYDNEAVGTVDG